MAKKKLEIYSMSAVMLIALALRLHGITRGLYGDEIFTAFYFVEVDSLWKTVSSYAMFNNHIAYSILARLSQSIFGRHEWALRLPALLLGLGGVWCLWFFGRVLVKPKIAVAAALALALSPSHVGWSESARGYSGMVLFTLISTYLYFKLLYRPRPADGFKFILASVIAIYFHLYAVFVTAVQLVFLPYIAGRRPAKSSRILWISFPLVGVLSLFCYAPVLTELFRNIMRFRHGKFVITFPLRVIEMFSGSTWILIAIPAFLMFILGLIAFRKSSKKEAYYFILLFFLPLLVAWLLRPYFLLPRFLAFFLPYYLLFLASGFFTLYHFAESRRNKINRYLAQALCFTVAISILSTWAINSWNDVQKEGFRDAARAMEAGAKPSAIFCAIGGGGEMIQYYLKRKIVVPDSMETFRRIIKTAPEVKCAYRDMGWGHPQHEAIAEFLSRHAESQQFRKITVFTYPARDNLRGQ